MRYPNTPDGRYFVVKGKLWRCTNPDLPESVRVEQTSKLMSARNAVNRAQRANDAAALAIARQAVDRAKTALGERGPVWWDDGSPDLNRHKVANTPYADWFKSVVDSGAYADVPTDIESALVRRKPTHPVEAVKKAKTPKKAPRLHAVRPPGPVTPGAGDLRKKKHKKD